MRQLPKTDDKLNSKADNEESGDVAFMCTQLDFIHCAMPGKQ